MSFRYIGSKARLIDQIASHVPPSKNSGYFVDSFCGTGAVAELAAIKGWNVKINDTLNSAVITSRARLISRGQAKFACLGGYDNAVQKLNACESERGFIWEAYSPASRQLHGVERKYFTECNAAKIDAVRNQISQWTKQGLINQDESYLLIADLLAALNRVANIAGTFGCFLSKWTKQSQNNLILQPRDLKKFEVEVKASVGDAINVKTSPDDLVYLDPPYTKRQYASYYHILETVALNDKPVVEGITGLRPWKHLASDYCYKTKALKTLIKLVNSMAAKQILLSYSSEGHVSTCELERELSKVGRLDMIPLGQIGRYRPNKTASNQGATVKEFLVQIDKSINPKMDPNLLIDELAESEYL